jgi:hypothetical protein
VCDPHFDSPSTTDFPNSNNECSRTSRSSLDESRWYRTTEPARTHALGFMNLAIVVWTHNRWSTGPANQTRLTLRRTLRGFAQTMADLECDRSTFLFDGGCYSCSWTGARAFLIESSFLNCAFLLSGNRIYNANSAVTTINDRD